MRASPAVKPEPNRAAKAGKHLPDMLQPCLQAGTDPSRHGGGSRRTGRAASKSTRFSGICGDFRIASRTFVRYCLPPVPTPQTPLLRGNLSGATITCTDSAAAVGSALPALRETVSDMDDVIRRLIQRSAAVLDEGEDAAKRLIEDEIEPFIRQARSDASAGEALVAMLRERLAIRPPAPSPGGENGAEPAVDLGQHLATFRTTTARNGALLVLLENGPLRLRPLRRRMQELEHPHVNNLSPALYKAAKHSSPPLVTHNEEGVYALTQEGRELAQALLA